MPTRRQRRLNGLLFEELSLLIPGRLDDPRLADAQVTRVETTSDVTVAKVYVTGGAADDEATARMILALEHAQGQLRSELGVLGLRRLPRLVFARDRQYESGERVLAILGELAEEDVEAGAPPPSEATPGDDPARSDRSA